MIMVRRNELACRDTWSGSLWAPIEGDADAAIPAFQRSANLGPVAPANTADLRAIINQDTTTAAANQGEDVLLSEARFVSETHRPPTPPPAAQPPASSRPPSAAGFDTRSAVFRAREAFRDKVRARETAARQSAGLEASSGSPPIQPTVASPDAEALPPAVSRDTRPRTPSPVTPAAEMPSSTVNDALFTPAPQAPAAEASSPGIGQWLPVPAEDEGAGAWSLQRWLEEPEPETEPEPVYAELALERLSELSETPLPSWFRTDLPRICRTCRDFRPATDGQRGWCANQWAFTHRTLVREEDVTPCDSAFGDWWAAVDDVWLVAADVSSHSRPTPLLDKIMPLTAVARKRS